MKVVFPVIVFLLICVNGYAQSRELILEEKFDQGEYELIIDSITPILDRSICESSDFRYLIRSHFYLGDYKNGLIYSEKWLNWSIERLDTNSIITASRFQSIALNLLEEIDQGIEAIESSFTYYREKDSIDLAAANLSLGLAYLNKGEPETAYDIYSKIDYDIVIADERQSEYLTNFGIIYDAMGYLDSSIAIMKKSILYKKEIGDEYGQVLNHSNIAASYYVLDDCDKALAHLDSTNIEGLDPNHPHFELVYQNYMTVYSYLNEVDSAFVYLDKLKDLNQSRFQERMDEEIAELKTSYEREANLENVIIKTTNDLEKSREQLLAWTIVVLLIVIIAGGIILFLRYKNVKSSRDNLLVTQSLLRSQMTPHFIFNSLSVLQGMILSKEDENSVLYLSKFSKLLRTVLENSRHKTASLSSELAAIDNYIALENFGVKMPYNYLLTIDESVNTKELRIPPMLIQPFIENAIKHAFVHEKDNFEIAVNIALKGKQLFCTIADNGMGIKASSKINKQDKSSLATAITSERLASLAKDFKTKGSVIIEDRSKFGDKGTIVTLVIPYKLEA